MPSSPYQTREQAERERLSPFLSFVVIAATAGCSLCILLLFASVGPSGPHMGAPVIPLSLLFLVAMAVFSFVGSIAALAIPKVVKKDVPFLRFCVRANYVCLGLFFVLIALCGSGVLKL